MSETNRYLVALYVAERRGSRPVPPGDVADAVGRSPSATTEMLQRLEERGLVEREPYRGARLTADGRTTAADLYERYVTLSRFFDDVLGMTDPESEAMRVAGTVSTTVVDRLDETLLDDGTRAERETTPSLPGADRS